MFKYNFAPLENEIVVAELEGELWARSSNPIERIFGAIQRILNLVLGIRRVGGLVVTNKRVIFFVKDVCCWCCPTNVKNFSLYPKSINQVGYERFGTLCQVYYLVISQSSGEQILVQLKGASEKDTLEYVNTVYSTIGIN